MNAPIDATHAESLNLIRQIRRRSRRAREIVARWEPAPCPPKEQYP